MFFVCLFVCLFICFLFFVFSYREQIDDICFLLDQHAEFGYYIDTSLEPQSTTRQSIRTMCIYRKPYKLIILNIKKVIKRPSNFNIIVSLEESSY
jgi:hypothetical protein